jgi:threonyl-tRNA synthetase
MPERFDLTCINEKGEKERIVMIHAAIMGSIERFLSIIIEYLGGAFPTWLAPVQARVLPITDAHKEYAGDVLNSLKAAGIRAEIDVSNETLGKKIRETKQQKIPYMLVIGDQEMKDGTATLESRDNGKVGMLKVEEIIARLKEEIENRS